MVMTLNVGFHTFIKGKAEERGLCGILEVPQGGVVATAPEVSLVLLLSVACL